MRRWPLAAFAAAVLVAAAAWAWFGRPALVGATKPAGNRDAAAEPAPADPNGRQPTLYCEFTNFADQTPLVGFYFLIEGAKTPPTYALIFQREKDGSQSGGGDDNAPRPEWRFDGSDKPAVLHSPDDATTINLYDYDPDKPGITWFEAGLRSIPYKNLGGKCRRSAT